MRTRRNQLMTIRGLISELEALAIEHGDLTPVLTLDNDGKPHNVHTETIVIDQNREGEVFRAEMGKTPAEMFKPVIAHLNMKSKSGPVFELAVRVW